MGTREITMKSTIIATLLGVSCLFLSMGTQSDAQESKGPTQFNLAILEEGTVSFVVPSASLWMSAL